MGDVLKFLDYALYQISKRTGARGWAHHSATKVKCKAAHDVRRLKSPNQTGSKDQEKFEITGADPSLILYPRGKWRPLALKPGHYRVFLNLTSKDRPVWRPRIYLDFGSGFSERTGQTFQLRKRQQDIWIAEFEINTPAIALRLDPSEREGGEITIVDLSIVQIDHLSGAQIEALDVINISERIENSKVFCAAPFIQTVVTATGEMHPCCVFNSIATSVTTRNPAEIWQAEEFVELRKNLSQDEPPVECAGCYEREKNNFVSARNVINRAWGELGWGNPNGETLSHLAAAASDNDFKVPNGPAWVELNLGNLCNLKCRMCNGDSSSSIASEPVHSHWSGTNSWNNPRWQSNSISILPRRVSGIEYEGFSGLDWRDSSAVAWINGRATIKLSNARHEISSIAFSFVKN